jgi:TRAP-type C4-dicarboxylate transport system permease small subunit
VIEAPARQSAVITTLVRGVGRADGWLASTERAVTIGALIAIVVILFLQTLLRYVSGILPLGDWLDPNRFMPPPDAVLGALDRILLGGRRGLAASYDFVVRGGAEVSRYSLVWAAVLGASVATREHRHIAVDALTRLLQKRGLTRAVTWSEVVIATLTAIVVGYLAFAGWVLYQSPPIQMRESAALRIPIRWVAIVLPIGLGIMTLRFLGGAITAALSGVGIIDPSVRYSGGGGLQAMLAEYKRERPSEAAP